MSTIKRLKSEIQASGTTIKQVAKDIDMSYQGLRMALINETLSVPKFEAACKVIGIEPASLYIGFENSKIAVIQRDIEYIKGRL